MSDAAIHRATGLLIIEVKNSNPNGDPDRESDPRRRGHDDRGVITGVSFKRKLRDLVLAKDGEVWKRCSNGFAPDEFDLIEQRGQEARDKIRDALKETDGVEKVKTRYWDARVFGATFLEEGSSYIRTGATHFGLGISISPVRVERMTKTKLAPAEGGGEGEAGPSRGMAPLAHRIVVHGLYCMPFFVNPTAALKSGCQQRDIGLLLKLIRHAYPHTKSDIRPFVDVRHAWYAEHKDPLCSFSEFRFIEAMSPKRKGDPETPSSDVVALEEQYELPRSLPVDITDKAENFCDLVETLPNWCNHV